MKPIGYIFICLFFFLRLSAQDTLHTSVLVIGGGTGGTAAAIQSARMQAPTILIEETRMLGGMLTAAGVSCTDGNDLLPSGIWQEFREALYAHYETRNLATGWVSETCFEPHVADSIFKAWAAHEKMLQVLYGWKFHHVLKEGKKIAGAVFYNHIKGWLTVRSKITVDATELGDVFAGSGEPFDLGTESPTASKESMAPGKTNIIQDLTWTATLKDFGAGTDHTIAIPPGYHEEEYDCCNTTAPCEKGDAYPVDAQKMLDYGKLPGNKYMINWPAHGNDSYLNVVNKKPVERLEAYREAKYHTLGFIYFIQTKLGYKNLGPAPDEMDSGLALIPYNREGRRVHGIVRMNVNHILHPYQQEPLYRTGISVGDYPVDHHHGQNPATPKIQFPKIPSFNIPVGALIPAHTDGLIICEKGISVSNIVNGATRLQPVVLLTGQAAGMLSAMAASQSCQPRQVPVRKLQEQLLRAHCFLMPYLDVDREKIYWDAIQRIGLTGILRGTGKPEGWENKTFFYPDSTMRMKFFLLGMKSFYPGLRMDADTGLVTIRKVLRLVLNNGFYRVFIPSRTGEFIFDEMSWGNQLHLQHFDPDRPLKKFEIAVMIDFFCKPFNEEIDMKGNRRTTGKK